MQTKTEIERELDFDLDKDLSTKITDLDDLMQYAPDKEQRDNEKTSS